MSSLPREVRFQLQSADGWLGLDNPGEAHAELMEIAEPYRQDALVMEVFWTVYAKWGKWKSAWEVARQMVQLHPEHCFGWIHRAYAARRMPGGGLAQALDFLLPAVERFPDEFLIPYNLACYCAQLNRLTDAKEWLEKAFRNGDEKLIRKMALEDPDFEPLRAIGYLK